MTNEPSPRPWRCECGPTVNAVIAANGAVVVPHTGYAANAALIVDAVNHMDYDLSIRTELNDARAKIDRLRDLVKRMADKLEVHRGIFTGAGVYSQTAQEETSRLLNEARAAIGEDKE